MEVWALKGYEGLGGELGKERGADGKQWGLQGEEPTTSTLIFTLNNGKWV